MAEIVNLRTARKRKARAAKEQAAAQNRTRFGRTRAERESAALKAGIDLRRLEAHRRSDGDETA